MECWYDEKQWTRCFIIKTSAETFELAVLKSSEAVISLYMEQRRTYAWRTFTTPPLNSVTWSISGKWPRPQLDSNEHRQDSSQWRSAINLIIRDRFHLGSCASCGKVSVQIIKDKRDLAPERSNGEWSARQTLVKELEKQYALKTLYK